MMKPFLHRTVWLNISLTFWFPLVVWHLTSKPYYFTELHDHILEPVMKNASNLVTSPASQSRLS